VTRLIERGLVTSVYQPIVDLQRMEVAGREALARPTAESGFKHAGELFDEIERVGLVWEGEKVTRDAAIAGFVGVPDGARLFLNASPAVIADDRLVADLMNSIARVPGLSPTRIVVEVTERSESSYTDAIVTRTEQLRGLGFEIAADDVGAGTSGLNRIMAIRPNWIKLDRDLITGIDADRAKRNMVKFLVSFGRLSGVKVLAEGIERQDELAALMDLGVVYAQGFHLARPGPVDRGIDPEVRVWLGHRQREMASGSLSDPRRVPLSRFARRATELPASTVVSAAATILLRERSVTGFVLTAQGRIVGWCGREAILRAAGDHRSFLAVETLASRQTVILEAEMPVAEALESAAARVDSIGSDPLILAGGGILTGIVTVGDLLSAAATVVTEIASRISPVTGLPSRASADEHMTALIRLAQHGGHAAFDAAMIDLRRFSEFNRRMGFGLGDDLLKRVAGMIKRTMVPEGETGSAVFVGHLGDDRFVVTAPAGGLREPLDRLMAEFERTECGAGFEVGEAGKRSGLGLRVLLLPEIFSRAASVGDVHRLAERVRAADRSEFAEVQVIVEPIRKSA
jgi:EAL domain-containing protein (putative c-di-GMP-specific phosphodiesterase class I)/GGDEF domain-containing protein